MSLNRLDSTEPLLSKPQEPELPERMKIGPQLPNQLLDLEPLYGDHKPKQRRRHRAKWTLHQPPAQSKPSFEKPPLKPLLPKPPLPSPPPPPPPQPRELQNRPNTKGRNTKKVEFNVSFIEPQIGQPQENQEQAANVKWRTINQSTRKWVRQKGSTATSTKALDNYGASTSGLINKGISIKPPADRCIEPPEPLQHQKSIQTIAKRSGRRQRREVNPQPEELRVGRGASTGQHCTVA